MAAVKNAFLIFYLLKYYFCALAFVTRLVVREDLALDDVDDSPKSKHLECASNVDDKESSVPLAMEFPDTANGMRQHSTLLLYTMSFPC